MKIPGAVYNLLFAALAAALIAAGGVIETALQTQFSDWVFAPVALAVVGMAVSFAKAWDEKGASSVSRSTFPRERRSFAKRFWLG